MTEKKCPYCFNGMDTRATVCPSCKKKVGSAGSDGVARKEYSLCQLFGVILMLLIIMGIFGTLVGKVKDAKEGVSTQKVQEVSLIEKAVKIKAKHPAWSNEICNIVAARLIQRGMTAEQVRAAWGKPQRNNESVGAWGTHEQWVYGDTYVYFENGLMTSWQSSK